MKCKTPLLANPIQSGNLSVLLGQILHKQLNFKASIAGHETPKLAHPTLTGLFLGGSSRLSEEK